MRLTPKVAPVAPKPQKPKARIKASLPMDRVFEVCAELASLHGGAPVVRQRTTETVREIFKALVSGIMLCEGEGYHPTAVCSYPDDLISAKALIEHARPYAIQAIEQDQPVSFKFSFGSGQTKVIYHGQAQPILTTGTASALLMVRKSAFNSAEISAFSVLSNIGRMALDNSELAGLCGTQKQKLDQLLEISADLGTSRLESFFPAFVVRAANFLGVSRVFVALVDQGECRLRWGASK